MDARSCGFVFIAACCYAVFASTGCEEKDKAGAGGVTMVAMGGAGGLSGAGGSDGFLNTGGTSLPLCRGLLCPNDSFCALSEDGICEVRSERGSCKPRPTSCGVLLVPVCGCDGQTYKNRCFAAQAGINVAATGACGGPAPRECGTRGLQPCPLDQFCYWETSKNCGHDDKPGVCAPIPKECPSEKSEVCGCDRKDYPNECAAAQLGLSLWTPGPCAFL